MLVKMEVFLQTSPGNLSSYYLLIFHSWVFPVTKLFCLLYSSFGSIREGLDLVKEAIGRTGYNEKIKISLDVAATEFCIGMYGTKEFSR